MKVESMSETIKSGMEAIHTKIAEKLNGLEGVTFRLDAAYQDNAPKAGQLTLLVTLWFHREFPKVIRVSGDADELANECRKTAEQILRDLAEKFGKGKV